MKPTRDLSGSRLAHMPRERKVALGALTVLLALLGSLIVYERLSKPTAPREEPAVDLQGETPAAVGPKQADTSVGIDLATEGPPLVKAALTTLGYPLLGKPTVLQPYAYAYSDLFGDFRMHHGVDFQAASGDAVLAAAPGTVKLIEADPLEGTAVELDHGGGLTTRYSGLGRVLVTRDSKVEAGGAIAQVGQPGPAKTAHGAHLHFEVRLNGESRDPANYLKP